MNTFPLTVSSPDGNVFKGDVFMLIVRGVEGELAVLKGHAPFITSIVPCDCRIECEDTSVKVGHTEGGILSVSKDSVTLLSSSFSWNEE